MSDVIWSQISSRAKVILTADTAGSWNITLKPHHVYLFEVSGAQGANGQTRGGVGGLGGKGSYASGWYDMRGRSSTVAITAFAGSEGSAGGNSNLSGTPDKYNGGAGVSGFSTGGKGGGASGIHLGSTPLIIAGGGAGGGGGSHAINGSGSYAGYEVNGGNGGGENGTGGGWLYKIGSNNDLTYSGGYGATQSGPGANSSGRVTNWNGSGGGGGGGGWTRGFNGGHGLADRHGTQGGRWIYMSGGGGSAGSFYTDGVQSIAGNSISTAWAQQSGDGMVKITEFVIDFPVASPNSRSEQFKISEPSASKVFPNGEFTFTMTLDESRTQASTPNITVNNASISAGAKTLTGGKYVITYSVYNITNPITAADYTITDVPINKYSVAHPLSVSDEAGGYTFSNLSKSIVDYDGSYTFKLTLSEGYSQATPIVKLLRNGNITQVENADRTFTYTVTNVKGFITAGDFSVSVKANQYMAVFDPMGGKHGEISNDVIFDGFIDNITHNDLIPKASVPDPTRTGYTFHGWYKSSDSGATLTTPWDFDNDKIEGVVTLYAKWIPYDFNLVYKNEDGASFNGTYPGGSMPLKHTYETTTTILKNPTRDGYTFGGWFLNGVQLNNNTLSASYLPNDPSHGKEIVIHARWIINTYYITYKNTDGTTYGKNEDHSFNLNWFGVYPTEFTVESADILFPEPARHGWDFKGWYTDKDGINPITKISTGRYSNITVYADWKEWEYEILIQRHNPSLPNDIRTVTIKYTDLSYNLSDLNFADKQDWMFMGWVYLSDLPIENSTLYEHDFNTLNENGKIVRRTTVVAKWFSTEMTIKFRTYIDKGTFDGYEGVDKTHHDYHEITIKVKHDEPIPFIYNPVTKIYSINGKDVNGYYFSHWAYLDNFGNYVYFNPITDRVMSSVTLHAYWILNTDSVQNIMTVLNNIDFLNAYPPYEELKINILFGLMTKAEQMITTGRIGTSEQFPYDVDRMTIDLMAALNDLLEGDSDLQAKIDALAYLEMLCGHLIYMLYLDDFSDYHDEIEQLATEVLQFLERPISSFTLEEITQKTKKVLDFFASIGVTISEDGQPELPINPPNEQYIYNLRQLISELEFYEQPNNNIRLTDTLKNQLADNLSQARQLLAKINKTDPELEAMLSVLTNFKTTMDTYIQTLANAEQLVNLQDKITTMTAYYNDAQLWAYIGTDTDLKASLQTVLANATSTTGGFNDPKLTSIRAQDLISQLETMKDLIDKKEKQVSLKLLTDYIGSVRTHLNAMAECENKTYLAAARDVAQGIANAAITTPPTATSADLKAALSDLKAAFNEYKTPNVIAPADPNEPNPKTFIVIAVVASLVVVVLFIGFIVIKKRKRKLK